MTDDVLMRRHVDTQKTEGEAECSEAATQQGKPGAPGSWKKHRGTLPYSLGERMALLTAFRAVGIHFCCLNPPSVVLCQRSPRRLIPKPTL